MKQHPATILSNLRPEHVELLRQAVMMEQCD